MTHEYTILTGGVVVASGHAHAATAIAWAADTILAIGDDAEVRAISRGDSRFVDLGGALVTGPGGAPIEVGGPADLVITAGVGDADGRILALVSAGAVIEGALPHGSGPKAAHDL